MVKRFGHLIHAIADYENIFTAHLKAQQAKRIKERRSIGYMDAHFDALAGSLIMSMLDGTYRTGEYHEFTLTERGKERVIYKLPYWPDRVTHHAIVQVLMPIWRPYLHPHTSSSIPGRGSRYAQECVRRWIREDEPGTRYCLQMDVRKFYPSVNHDLMVKVLARRIKDGAVMTLLEEITRSIDVTAPGVGIPIGNYLSQWFANLYLAELDWLLAADPRVAHFHRYCDDVVVFGPDKAALHHVRVMVDEWLARERNLTLKPNWRLFPITDTDRLDFVGYQFFRNKTLLRKRTKKRMINTLTKPSARVQQAGAYNGWTSFGNTHNLHEKFVQPVMDEHAERKLWLPQQSLPLGLDLRLPEPPR